jgi:UDP-N-acetylmuramoyl-tripeptide--D-alanyl-D-alanine ligase
MAVKWGDIRVQQIISPVAGELIKGNSTLPIAGLSTDSREPLQGRIFFALKGEKYDGHDFVMKAAAQGASCIVVDKDHDIEIPSGEEIAVIKVKDTLKALGDLASWWRHQFNVKVAAITGSAGKTTTKEMTAQILGLESATLKNKGNLNNLIGLPLTVFRLEGGISRMILEMGMNRPGEIGGLTEIADPDVGLITNVGKAHLEGLGDLAGVARAKTELLEKIAPGGTVILNGDDDILIAEASRFNREIITFGLKPGNHIRADLIKNMGAEGISFEIQHEGSKEQVLIPLQGTHNVYNALAAASIALYMGAPFSNIAPGLNRYDGMNGRFKSIPLSMNITLVDDTYNSNPSSLKAALGSVKDMASGGKRIIAGLGEMLELGDETVNAHVAAGKMVAETGASWLFVLGDHAGEMIDGAVKNGLPAERVVEVKSCEEMAIKLGGVLVPGDVILLKGSRRIGLDSVARDLEGRLAKEV